MFQRTASLPLHQTTLKFMLIAVVLGFAIGALTLLLQKLLPDSLIQFANSGAVWSILAFMIGRVAQSRRIAIIAGFLALSGEVAGYYTAAYFANLMDISAGTLAVVGYWLVIALVAGPFFGWAGYASVHSRGLIQKIGVASLGALFMGEGLYLLSILPKPNTGLLWLAVALLLTLYWTWKNAERFQFWLVTIGLGLIFFIGENALVLLDGLRAALFQG